MLEVVLIMVTVAEFGEELKDSRMEVDLDREHS
jgi:hypothetical protein